MQITAHGCVSGHPIIAPAHTDVPAHSTRHRHPGGHWTCVCAHVSDAHAIVQSACPASQLVHTEGQGNPVTGVAPGRQPPAEELEELADDAEDDDAVDDDIPVVVPPSSAAPPVPSR